MSITGRIKELIITAGGENVAPVLIENQIKEELQFISNAMVVRDKWKYLVILLTLKLALDKDGKPLDTLSEDGTRLPCQNLLGGVSEGDWWGDQKATEKSISRAQHIRNWALIPGDFTVDGGELTPTLKLKRKFTASNYADAILKLYQDPKL